MVILLVNSGYLIGSGRSDYILDFVLVLGFAMTSDAAIPSGATQNTPDASTPINMFDSVYRVQVTLHDVYQVLVEDTSNDMFFTVSTPELVNLIKARFVDPLRCERILSLLYNRTLLTIDFQNAKAGVNKMEFDIVEDTMKALMSTPMLEQAVLSGDPSNPHSIARHLNKDIPFQFRVLKWGQQWSLALS